MDSNDIKHFTDISLSLGFHPFIDKHSRISTQTTTLIDNITTNILNVSHEGRLLLTDISDYLPVFCVTNHNFTPQQEQKMNLIQIRNDTNMLLSKETLNQQDLNSLCQ